MTPPPWNKQVSLEALVDPCPLFSLTGAQVWAVSNFISAADSSGTQGTLTIHPGPSRGPSRAFVGHSSGTDHEGKDSRLPTRWEGCCPHRDFRVPLLGSSTVKDGEILFWCEACFCWPLPISLLPPPPPPGLFSKYETGLGPSPLRWLETFRQMPGPQLLPPQEGMEAG